MELSTERGRGGRGRQREAESRSDSVITLTSDQVRLKRDETRDRNAEHTLSQASSGNSAPHIRANAPPGIRVPVSTAIHHVIQNTSILTTTVCIGIELALSFVWRLLTSEAACMKQCHN